MSYWAVRRRRAYLNQINAATRQQRAAAGDNDQSFHLCESKTSSELPG
jgi:hypothetical protein